MGVVQLLIEAAKGHWAVFISLVFVILIAKNHFHHGLNRYPGPLIAGLTNVWRFVDVWKRRPECTHMQLHKKHGDIVRLGPNVLSFADPKAVKDIYGLNKGYIKSGFYPVQQPVSKGRSLPSLFSTTDEQYHAQLKRCVSGAFSMTALVQYEPGADLITELFLRRTEELYASTGQQCDFTEWLQYYAFDVIGQITYSKSHGFVEGNHDIDGMIKFLRATFDYVAPIGQIPWLDYLLKKNPVFGLLDRFGLMQATSGVVRFARANMDQRQREADQGGDVEKQSGMPARVDLLSKFLKAKDDHPDFFHDGRVLIMANTMALAGSETTAISLAAVFYYLLKYPETYQKIMTELDEAVAAGGIERRENGLVSWSESQRLSYLDACVKEAFRLFPAAGLPLERVVPKEGTEICGNRIAGGTIVGCSAWVIHRRKEVFGHDVDVFRPGRWLECSKEARKEMDGTLLQFGAGSRTCIGKNISLLEIYKLVPAVLLRFEISLADPSKEWTPHNAWFVRQKDFYVKFKLRKSRHRT